MFNKLIVLSLLVAFGATLTDNAWSYPKKPSDWAIENIEKKALKRLKKAYGLGPYPQEIAAFTSTQPAILEPFYLALYADGTRNVVLNYLRIGLGAIEIGDYARAESAIDIALDRIEAVYANDPKAKKARSVWSKESVKAWKGEPYERSMAYYYRGLLYLREGDFENARASFLQAEFQDTIAEQEEFNSDFAVMNYLAGWASHCAQDDVLAGEFYGVARQHNPNLVTPKATDNVLFIAEVGTAPLKKAEGKHNQTLVIEGSSSVNPDQANFLIPGISGQIVTQPASSVSFQATTRGGRAVQSILDGKAKFVDNAESFGRAGQEIGTAAMYVGVSTNDSNVASVGAAFAVAGMFASAMAEAAKPDADTRTWDNLPDTIRVGTTSTQVPLSNIQVSYDGQVQPASVLSNANSSCGLAWSRTHSSLNVADASIDSKPTKRERKFKKKLWKLFGDSDRAFRKVLLSSSR